MVLLTYSLAYKPSFVNGIETASVL